LIAIKARDDGEGEDEVQRRRLDSDMAIKDILVHVTEAEDTDGRAAVAAALAKAHDAHVTGLYTLYITPLPAYVQSQIGNDLIEHQRNMYRDMIEEARAAFMSRMEAEGVAAEWRRVEGERSHSVAVNARYCDLLIMGQRDSAGGDSARRLVESAVLESGKPVIMMPETAPARPIGKHVLAAWSGTRESARAIDAALPLLAAAERVDVIAVDPREGDTDAHGQVPAADLCRHLARHGVRAEAQSVSGAGHGAGEILLGRAVADGADLLVMGAYGHSRWREMVLGGATEYVLHHAKIPVLMAH
jgi:nucleotide-binding universal stress UspA family protein